MTTRTIFNLGALAVFTFFSATSDLRAQSQDVVAVITELKLKQGDVQIRLPGKSNAERPGVLQSLVPGTRVMASRDAVAVVLFIDGSRTVTVNETNSPFEITASSTKTEQASSALGQVTALLLGKKQPPTYAALSTRGSKKPPTLLSPRNTKLMTETPNLQWTGMDQQPATVRVYGPEGVIWTADSVALTQIKYPSNAAPLKAGVEYSWSLEKKGFPPEKVSFKVIGAGEAKAVRDRLASLPQATATSPTTLAILKASLLISGELYHEAREILTEAVKSDPDEPTLHFLMARCL